MSKASMIKEKMSTKVIHIGQCFGATDISPEEIEEYIEGFVIKAEQALSPGISGIQISASEGSIFHRFLDPGHNRRLDRYGGSLENRARFLLETIRAVRGAVDGSVPISLALSEQGVDDRTGPWLRDKAETVYFFSLLASNGVDGLALSQGSSSLDKMAKHYSYFKSFNVSQTAINASLV